jgi:hypothetical protein
MGCVWLQTPPDAALIQTKISPVEQGRKTFADRGNLHKKDAMFVYFAKADFRWLSTFFTFQTCLLTSKIKFQQANK